MKIGSSALRVALEAPLVFGIPADFVLFGLTLLGVALFHRHTLRVALAGLVTIAIYKIMLTGFKTGSGVMGFVSHVGQEWVNLVNLLCLLMGFVLGLGFLSAVFDNIPLTALALKQDGYDWGLLAFSVGFGGSMIWFGSSSGVALSNMYPEAKSVGRWLRHAWYIPVAYVIGFFVMLVVWNWLSDVHN
jgi:hypothetical protein